MSVIQISPKGGDISGNITVLVVGTGFQDFGANSRSPALACTPITTERERICVLPR